MRYAEVSTESRACVLLDQSKFLCDVCPTQLLIIPHNPELALGLLFMLVDFVLFLWTCFSPPGA